MVELCRAPDQVLGVRAGLEEREGAAAAQLAGTAEVAGAGGHAETNFRLCFAIPSSRHGGRIRRRGEGSWLASPWWEAASRGSPALGGSRARVTRWKCSSAPPKRADACAARAAATSG